MIEPRAKQFAERLARRHRMRAGGLSFAQGIAAKYTLGQGRPTGWPTLLFHRVSGWWGNSERVSGHPQPDEQGLVSQWPPARRVSHQGPLARVKPGPAGVDLLVRQGTGGRRLIQRQRAAPQAVLSGQAGLGEIGVMRRPSGAPSVKEPDSRSIRPVPSVDPVERPWLPGSLSHEAEPSILPPLVREGRFAPAFRLLSPLAASSQAPVRLAKPLLPGRAYVMTGKGRSRPVVSPRLLLRTAQTASERSGQVMAGPIGVTRPFLNQPPGQTIELDVPRPLAWTERLIQRLLPLTEDGVIGKSGKTGAFIESLLQRWQPVRQDIVGSQAPLLGTTPLVVPMAAPLSARDWTAAPQAAGALVFQATQTPWDGGTPAVEMALHVPKSAESTSDDLRAAEAMPHWSGDAAPHAPGVVEKPRDFSGTGAKPPSIPAVAEQVYRLLERRLVLERERRGVFT